MSDEQHIGKGVIVKGAHKMRKQRTVHILFSIFSSYDADLVHVYGARRALQCAVVAEEACWLRS